MNLPGIEYKGDISKFIESENDPYSNICFYKDLDYFRDEILYSKFVKKCEQQIRTSKDYSTFISYIKSVLGINYCQVLSQIYDSDNVKGGPIVEMHHGPLFTLYDITSAVLNWFLKTGTKINTFRIIDRVLEEHYDLRVQVVMLSTVAHEASHVGEIFLNLNHGIGNINEFIKFYADCLDDIHKYKIWNYIEYSKNNPSFDKGILDTEHIQKIIKM